MASIDHRIQRPILRYMGSKWMMAPWIVEHFPPHTCYVEPFGGGASVMLRKAPARYEIYNDLDSDVVNLFRVMRDPDQSTMLARLLSLTPYARQELEAARELSDNPIERARRLLIRAWCTHGHESRIANSSGLSWPNIKSKYGNCYAPQNFAQLAESIGAVCARMRGVTIEHLDALELIRRVDSGHDVLIYCDPPYLGSTRHRAYYGHEMMGEVAHAALLAALVACRSMVVISGYHHPLYDDALAGWHRVERDAVADGGRSRVEVLWVNPRAWRALARGVQAPLF